MTVVSPVVQIVAGGTNWPAIIAAISTGVVGLAGIGGTLWQGKRSREAQAADLKASLDASTENIRLGIKAENDRLRATEKRRVYAHCAAMVVQAWAAALKEQNDRKLSAPVQQANIRTRIETIIAAINAGVELELIGPREVTKAVTRAIRYLYREGLKESEFIKLQAKMRDAMRGDLGEAD